MFSRLLGLAAAVFSAAGAGFAADPASVLAAMQRADDHFRREWPDPAMPIVTDQERPSNIWTRGVYYEGLMALYAIDRSPARYAYAVDWGRAHGWQLRDGPLTRNADDQCCGQTYLQLYRLDPRPERIAAIQQCLRAMAASRRRDDWSWIDAIQMSLPAFALLGAQTGDARLFTAGHEFYVATRDGVGGRPALFNPEDGLWWRDGSFAPPYRTARGRQSYWSRGNGWVFVAMARALEFLPGHAAGRADYRRMMEAMAPAIRLAQRSDGFWNADLGDPENFGGPETSGTALFTAGLAAGIRLGILPAERYLPAAERGWNALADRALHPDGFLGYVQGTGKQPSEGRPVTYGHQPDFDDFGTGCFLLAGAEVWQLSSKHGREQ